VHRQSERCEMLNESIVGGCGVILDNVARHGYQVSCPARPLIVGQYGGKRLISDGASQARCCIGKEVRIRYMQDP